MTDITPDAPAPEKAAAASDRLRAAHRINAMALAGFILLHMVTHLSGLFGIEAYNTVQAALRTIYRYPPVEALLLVSISAQIAMGAVLLWRSIRRARPRGGWAWLQIVSGVAFLLFMVQHLYSLGVARIGFGLDTDFYWPASVMSGPWFIYYFTPYYIIGVFALFAHIAAGARYALLDAGRARAAARTGWSLLIIGGAIALTIPPIIAGAFYDIALPQPWIEYLRFYAPEFEPWR